MTTMADPNITTPSPEYAALEVGRKPMRVLMDGTRAIRVCNTTYLPKWEGEKEGREGVAGYRRRLGAAVLDPFYRDAVLDLVARVFAKPIILGEDVPPAIRGVETEGGAVAALAGSALAGAERLIEGLVSRFPAIQAELQRLLDILQRAAPKRRTKGQEGLWENIDNAGTHGHEFCRAWFSGAWAEGEGGVLVEHSPLPADRSVRTKADEQALARRPYWVHYPAANILEVMRSVEHGRPVLTRVRLREADKVEPDGVAGEKRTPRARHLIRGSGRLGVNGLPGPGYYARWELWERRKDADQREIDVLAESGEMLPHQEIPFVLLRLRPDGSPPLEDLGWNNIAYYQQRSQLEDNLFMAAVHIFTAVGITQEQYDKIIEAGIASGAIWWTTNPEAEGFGVIDIKPDIGKLLMEKLDHLEKLIHRQAREPLIQRTGAALTATADKIAEARAASLLESAAIQLQDRIEELLGFTAGYLAAVGGVLREPASGGSVTVNRRFGFLGNSAELLRETRELRKQGDLTRKTLLKVYEAAQALPDTFDLDVELEQLAMEGQLGALGAEEELRGKVADLEARMPKPTPAPGPEREDVEAAA